MDVGEVIVGGYGRNVEVEGDGVHAVTLAGDGALRLVVLPLGSEVGSAGEHLPVQVGTRGVVALRLATGILAGTIPERDLVGFACCPFLVGRVDEELGIP